MKSWHWVGGSSQAGAGPPAPANGDLASGCGRCPPGRNPLSLCTAAARTRFPRVSSPGGPASSVHAGKAGLTPSAKTAQPGLCGAARNSSGDCLPRPASTGPWPRRLRLRTGICGLTSRERPRSDLQRSPFWLLWLLFRRWRRRWNPRLLGYRAWRGAHGQPRRSRPTVRRWLWSLGTSWRASGPCWGPCCRSTGCCRGGWRTWRTCCATETSGCCGCSWAARGRPPRPGHHQARSSGASGERREAGSCSLPSVERGQSPGTGFREERRAGGLRETCPDAASASRALGACVQVLLTLQPNSCFLSRLHSPWVKGLSLAVISLSSSTLHGAWHTQASWKRPQEFRPGSSKRKGQVGGASRAHRRPLWHTCAQRPVWAAKRRGVWREGLRATSQSGLLEGVPGKEGSWGSTCGGLLPDPREREVASLPPGPPSQAEPAVRGTEQCPPCAQCGQSFGWKELSAPHQCAYHGPWLFAGAQCPKSVAQWATPASHHRAHVAERTYTCAQ
ncbi:uncharacterized protein [Symphalangus syndactylus]|uniref:uncharacterized protein n=1 Tax=Symphalangus syndactylus TaxID=9590 RepID=UPI003007E3C1